MKQNFFLSAYLLFTVVCFSCKNTSNKSVEIKTIDPVNQKMPTAYSIDSLEHFFGNENWRMINKKDTSYILFSRQSDMSIKLYQYKMQKGDSVGNTISFISMKNDSIRWTQSARELILEDASITQLKWKVTGDTTSIVFRHTSPDTILLTEGMKKSILVKTINFSDFLARSRYDYLHGTNIVNDTASFNSPKK